MCWLFFGFASGSVCQGTQLCPLLVLVAPSQRNSPRVSSSPGSRACQHLGDRNLISLWGRVLVDSAMLASIAKTLFSCCKHSPPLPCPAPRSAGSEARTSGRGERAQALRPVPCGGAHHVPRDQHPRATAPPEKRLHFPRHQRTVPPGYKVSPSNGLHLASDRLGGGGIFQGFGARDAALRQRGRQHQGESQEDRQAPLQGFLATVPQQSGRAQQKGTCTVTCRTDGLRSGQAFHVL